MIARGLIEVLLQFNLILNQKVLHYLVIFYQFDVNFGILFLDESLIPTLQIS